MLKNKWKFLFEVNFSYNVSEVIKLFVFNLYELKVDLVYGFINCCFIKILSL